MTSPGLKPRCSTKAARTMVVSAITEPTERSIPPEMMTKVIPIAAITRKELSINKLRKTWSEKKPLNATEPAPNITTKSPTVITSGT